MKVARLLGCLLAIPITAGLIVGLVDYGDVIIPLPIAIPTLSVAGFLFAYIASLIFTNSFTALPKALIDFFRG